MSGPLRWFIETFAPSAPGGRGDVGRHVETSRMLVQSIAGSSEKATEALRELEERTVTLRRERGTGAE